MKKDTSILVSPYDVSSAIFQYSSQNESMPVSKLTSNENALKDISSRLNQPSSHSIEAKSNNKSLPIRSENIDMTDFIRQAAIQRAFGGRAKMCTFCKSNGECQQIYTSHTLKDSNDKITCPILLKYACPICGATGEQTHTKKYCPVLQKKLKLQMINKMTISSK